MTHKNLKNNISIKNFVYSGQIVQNGNVNKNSNDCSTLLLAVYTAGLQWSSPSTNSKTNFNFFFPKTLINK